MNDSSPINLPRNRRASLPTLSVSSTTSTTAPLLHPSSPAHQFMADIKPQTRSSVIQLNPAYLTQSGREQVNVTLSHDAPWYNFERPLVSIYTIERVLQNCINVRYTRCDTDMWQMWHHWFRIQHPWRGMDPKGVIQKMKSLMSMSPTKWKLKPSHWHKLKD